MKKHLIILVTFMLMLGGCASQKTIYYWGDYSDAAYQFEKEPTEKTLIAYKTELLDIASEDLKGTQSMCHVSFLPKWFCISLSLCETVF